MEQIRPHSDDLVIARACEVLEERLKYKHIGPLLESPDAIRKLLRLKLSQLEHEVFYVMFLDNKHRLIDSAEIFRGTIDGAAVYTREVIKEALKRNAAALVIAHNHPSGSTEPSKADRVITKKLADALALVDIRLLDHFIVAGLEDPLSFAEHGLL